MKCPVNHRGTRLTLILTTRGHIYFWNYDLVKPKVACSTRFFSTNKTSYNYTVYILFTVVFIRKSFSMWCCSQRQYRQPPVFGGIFVYSALRRVDIILPRPPPPKKNSQPINQWEGGVVPEYLAISKWKVGVWLRMVAAWREVPFLPISYRK